MKDNKEYIRQFYRTELGSFIKVECFGIENPYEVLDKITEFSHRNCKFFHDGYYDDERDEYALAFRLNDNDEGDYMFIDITISNDKVDGKESIE